MRTVSTWLAVVAVGLMIFMGGCASEQDGPTASDAGGRDSGQTVARGGETVDLNEVPLEEAVDHESDSKPVESSDAAAEPSLATSPAKSPQAGRASGRSVQPGTARELKPQVKNITEHAYQVDQGKKAEAARSSLQPQTPPTDLPAHEGRGPGVGGDKYARIYENAFRQVGEHPLSTFSIDVDTASYANTRRFLLANNMLPPAGAVRIEELINYFSYDYKSPEDETPFATHVEVATCPWQPAHRLVRVGLKGREINQEDRPASNLVFLLDVSGSMNSPDKLPLLKQGMVQLLDQLGENDRVAIVVYAGASGLVLPSTPGYERSKIREAVERLQSGGSTAGAEGIRLAYQVALDNFIKGGINRVLLGTDGDFNVGTTSTAELVKLVEEKAKSGVFLSVLGFGRGNLNDSMMEDISNKGNGNYAYIDSDREASKVLVQQVGGTLVTIAKDVKIQIEFNPAEVASYRLIGYENRMLKKEDFNDDKKDAGEIGAGHTVTALYEVVPAGSEVNVAAAKTPPVDDLEFQSTRKLSEAANSGKLMILKLRYKQPNGDTSKLLKFPVSDNEQSFSKASGDFQFAAAVASFGMLLRDSEYKGQSTYASVEEIASSSRGKDEHGYRAEFLELVRKAKQISEQK